MLLINEKDINFIDLFQFLVQIYDHGNLFQENYGNKTKNYKFFIK